MGDEVSSLLYEKMADGTRASCIIFSGVSVESVVESRLLLFFAMTHHFLQIAYEEFPDLHALSPAEADLAQRAQEAQQHAYAPYSHFAVGAALQTETGEIFTGSNQENVNFKGSCAERVALDTAASHGFKHGIRTIAIVGNPVGVHGENAADHEPISPCGQCRQDLREVEDLGGTELVILLVAPHCVRRFTGMRQLLPFGVGPQDLGERLLGGKK